MAAAPILLVRLLRRLRFGRCPGPSAAIEQAHDAIRAVRNDFAHSATDPSLAEPRHQKRLQRVDPEAETSPLMSRPCRGGCRRR
jgi:hypothetical protein